MREHAILSAGVVATVLLVGCSTPGSQSPWDGMDKVEINGTNNTLTVIQYQESSSSQEDMAKIPESVATKLLDAYMGGPGAKIIDNAIEDRVTGSVQEQIDKIISAGGSDAGAGDAEFPTYEQ